MVKFVAFVACMLATLQSTPVHAEDGFESDTISTREGDLVIVFIGHGSLMFTFRDTVIHIDPWSRLADYTTLPKADIVLITHEHTDHLDQEALGTILTDSTHVLCTESCIQKGCNGIAMRNGDVMHVASIRIEAVPAYNIVHHRPDGTPFHPKGIGNGYVVTVAGKRIYIAGDTEDIPEMKQLENIDIAFLPMNIPYTMTPEMTANAARIIKPSILYPYHFGDTDTARIIDLLKDNREIDVRIRRMQ